MAIFYHKPQVEIQRPNTAEQVAELLKSFALSIAIESCEQREAGEVKISTQLDRIVSQCDHAVEMINFNETHKNK
jgi:hypothetical protein